MHIEEGPGQNNMEFESVQNSDRNLLPPDNCNIINDDYLEPSDSPNG